jgi:hypothetical protein
VTEEGKSTFGSCCRDLHDTLNGEFERLFHIDDAGILRVSVGFVQIENGRVGWFDQAVMFCPFCGDQLQTAEGIALAAKRH